MILDSVNHIDSYRSVHPRIWAGLQLLRTDLSGLADGRYELDGDRIFYMIQTYMTKPVNDLPEAHRKYADIQCVLSGAECIDVGDLAGMTEVEAYPERDLRLYHGRLDRLTMTPGRFMVLFPQDAHAAAIAVLEPELCHKVVIKVLLD